MTGNRKHRWEAIDHDLRARVYQFVAAIEVPVAQLTERKAE